MTEETESPIGRPSIEGEKKPRELPSVGTVVGRKRVIMTKNIWSAEDIRRLFRTLDQDQSERLSFEEFATGLKELGFEMKADAAKALYRKMDVDGDGRITETEFVKLMRNMNREKLSTQLSASTTSPSSPKRQKAVNVSVVDVGYSDGAGHFEEHSYTRADFFDKYCKDLPSWKRHARWIDVYGTDSQVMEFLGNECDLSNRMVDETTVKHTGKIQYYPEENTLQVVVHALFLTKKAVQSAAKTVAGPTRSAWDPRTLFAKAASAAPAIPLSKIGRRNSFADKKTGQAFGDDDEAEDDDGEEKDGEADSEFELVPERYYESPNINMSQLVILCMPNTIITVRRRSNNTNIEHLFDGVKEDLKHFITGEIRSSLETPTTKDMLLSFIHEVNEHNFSIRNEFNDWKVALEKDINAWLKKYHARHLLDLSRNTSKAVTIIEPFVEDFVALTAGEEEEDSSDEKGKLKRRSSHPVTGDEKKGRQRTLASAAHFIGDKKAAFKDAAESSARLLTQLKYAVETANQLGTYYKHQMDDRQSKALGYLTVITGTIFPTQLLTGVYGMNFEVLPELTYEYAYLIFWLINLFMMALLLKFWHSRGFF